MVGFFCFVTCYLQHNIIIYWYKRKFILPPLFKKQNTICTDVIFNIIAQWKSNDVNFMPVAK